jgi:hypothetical protein
VNGRTLLIAIMALSFLTKLFGGSREQSSVDLSTPEHAVHSLEHAWRANDIEKAVLYKDFRGEAEQILRDKPAEVRTEDIIAQTARVLEQSYRAEIKKSGFPKVEGVTSTFSEKRQLSSDRVELTEVFRFPDGSTHTEKVQVRHTKDGWKIISAP